MHSLLIRDMSHNAGFPPKLMLSLDRRRWFGTAKCIRKRANVSPLSGLRMTIEQTQSLDAAMSSGHQYRTRLLFKSSGEVNLFFVCGGLVCAHIHLYANCRQ